MDHIFRSMKGARRAEPDPLLFERIRAKIAVPMQIVRRPYLVAAAACLLLLVAVNVRALTDKEAEPRVTTAYQVEPADFDLYE